MSNASMLREAIVKRLPEGFEEDSELLKAIDKLITGNDNDYFDEEETITLFIEKFFAGMSVLDKSEISSIKYAYACKFVSYRMMGVNEARSFELTYPDRAAEASVKYDKDAYFKSMSRRGRMMSKDSMVIKVMDFASVPIHVTNAPLVQAALDKLEYLMNNSYDDKVQLGAAQTILQEVRKPEALEIEHKVTGDEELITTLDSFRQLNAELSARSSKMIGDGKITLSQVDNKFKKQIAHKVG